MRKILVTGASSFLGKHTIPRLLEDSNYRILNPSSKELNLLDFDTVTKYFQLYRPNIILHMAANCGGIFATKENPAIILHDNLKMVINLFDAVKNINNLQEQVTHFYGIGTISEYPENCKVPFVESDIWNGKPQEAHFPYSESKRVMLLMQETFRKQFKLKGAHLVLTSMYGEYDNFDPRHGKVITSLIRKIITAKSNKDSFVKVIGDGTPTRDFLYVEDGAKIISSIITKNIDSESPINVATGESTSVKELAFLIKDIIGYHGDIIFSGDCNLNGQNNVKISIDLLKSLVEMHSCVKLRDGLEKTIDWFQSLGNSDILL